MERKCYRCGPADRFEIRVGPLYTNLLDYQPASAREASTACASEADALRTALERVSHPAGRRAARTG